MATRSFICKLQSDGSVKGIYCHHDGYPDGVGWTLQECYMDPDKVDQLLALGDISSLGGQIGEKHPFEASFTLEKDWTTAYHRDRGEALTSNRIYADIKSAVDNVHSDMGAEWVHVFQYDGWKCYETTFVI